MASQGPRASKERPARRVMLAPQVLRAPLELLGLRWVVPSSPRSCSHRAGATGCRVRGGPAENGWEAWATPYLSSGPLTQWTIEPTTLLPQGGEAAGGGVCTLGDKVSSSQIGFPLSWVWGVW